MNIHEQDQAFAALLDMAKLFFQYYNTLVNEGFNEEQAMQMTIAYQAAILTGE